MRKETIVGMLLAFAGLLSGIQIFAQSNGVKGVIGTVKIGGVKVPSVKMYGIERVLLNAAKGKIIQLPCTDIINPASDSTISSTLANLTRVDVPSRFNRADVERLYVEVADPERFAELFNALKIYRSCEMDGSVCVTSDGHVTFDVDCGNIKLEISTAGHVSVGNSSGNVSISVTK
jgi:hypothetical protein